MNFNVDWNIIVRWMIPTDLRGGVMVPWVKSLLRPIVDVYQTFLRYKAAKEYELMITGQVCYLEMMLRDKYDFTLRRIYIKDGEEHPPLYLYQDEEDHDISLYLDSENLPVTLFTDGESEGEDQDDFIVMVPIDINFSEEEMRSMLLKKRLPGMRFKIQTY